MTTLAQKPLSEAELRELIAADTIMATAKYGNLGNEVFVCRNEERRREYEIRAAAMTYLLHTTAWIKP